MEYNIIITSDVLAEGVNLHRSNVIVNYDSPWNATRLMQRIGRVNRIGSVAPNSTTICSIPRNRETRRYSYTRMRLSSCRVSILHSEKMHRFTPRRRF